MEQQLQNTPEAKPLPLRSSRVPWLAMIVVFAVALVARGGLAGFRHFRGADLATLEFPDEEQYWLMAGSLYRGDGLADELGFRATRMPLYPSLLAPFTASSNGVVYARIVHWIIGALAAALAAGLAGAMFGNRVAWLGGLAVAVDPFLAMFSSLLLTETLSIAAVCALWWVSWAIYSRRTMKDVSLGWFVLLGLMAAFCVHVRESNVFLVGLLLVFVVLACRCGLRSLVGAGIAATIVVASLLPWAVRNEQVTGSWCWLTNRGGISLYDGVGPQATGASDLGDIKAAPAIRHFDEVEWNRYFLHESYKSIADDPVRIVRLAGVKFLRTWNPIPNVETYQSGFVRIVAGCWMVPVYLLAILGAVVVVRRYGRRGGIDLLFLALPAVHIVVLHSVFVGSVRYRLGVHPMLEILAGVTFVLLVDIVAGSSNRKGRSTDGQDPAKA